MAESILYDVHDFKVAPMLTDPAGGATTYGPFVDVPGVAEVSLSPNFATAELKGDAKIIARKGRVDQVNMSCTYGKLSQEVLKVVLGGSLAADRYALPGVNSLSYFQAAFTIDDLDVGLGSCHVRVFKAQLTGGTLVGTSSDNFGQPTMDISGIAPDGTPGDIFSIEFFTAKTPLVGAA